MRSPFAAGLLLLVAVLISMKWWVHGWFDLTYDGSMYIACARSLLAGEGYTYLGEPFQVRPPGFSVLLMPLLRLSGSSEYALNLYVSAFGALAVVLLFAFLRRDLGTLCALAVSVALWVNPPFQRLCNQVLSDVPSVALMLAILLLERSATRVSSYRRDIVLGIAIGVASYVRTINVLFVPAILASRVLRELAERRRASTQGSDDRWGDHRGDRGRMPWPRFALARLAVVAGVPVLVLLPWSLRNRALGGGDPPDQHPLHSYSVAMWRTDKGDPDSPPITAEVFADRVTEKVGPVLSAIGSGLEVNGYRPLFAALGLVALAACAVEFWRKRESAEAFALIAALTLAGYFGFSTRLVLPVALLGFCAATKLFVAAARRWAGGLWGELGTAALIFALAAWDCEPRKDWPLIRGLHEKFAQRAAEVEELVPPNARLATMIGHNYSVFLRRPVYSFRVSLSREPSPESVERIIDKYGIDSVVLFTEKMMPRRLLKYFEERYGITGRIGHTYFIRVREIQGSPESPRNAEG